MEERKIDEEDGEREEKEERKKKNQTSQVYWRNFKKCLLENSGAPDGLQHHQPELFHGEALAGEA